MRGIVELERWVEQWSLDAAAAQGAAAPGELLTAAEDIMACWLIAHDKGPTMEKHEGFRLLALHRQGAKGDPSFNACRETCREVAYRYNLAHSGLDPEEWRRNLSTMRRTVQHLAYFISGKMQDAAIGDFCCASKPLRSGATEAILEGETRQ